MLARAEHALRQDDLVAGRDRHEHVGGKRSLCGRGDVHAEFVGDGARAQLVDVPDRHLPATGEERPRHSAPVHACADDGGRPGVRARQHLRGQDRSRSGAQGGDGGRVHDRLEPSVVGGGQEHDAAHRRQPEPRIARERVDPLQQGMSAAQRRHRAEVAGRIVRDVHLRRHRPLAARMRDEALPYRLDRPLRRHRLLDVAGGEDEDARQSVLTDETSFSTDSFASPKSIDVCGSTKSGLSTPAKPVAIERFITTTCFAWSTFRIGMP